MTAAYTRPPCVAEPGICGAAAMVCCPGAAVVMTIVWVTLLAAVMPRISKSLIVFSSWHSRLQGEGVGNTHQSVSWLAGE